MVLVRYLLSAIGDFSPLEIIVLGRINLSESFGSLFGSKVLGFTNVKSEVSECL